MYSDVEAFSYNPTDGRVAPLSGHITVGHASMHSVDNGVETGGCVHTCSSGEAPEAPEAPGFCRNSKYTEAESKPM